MAYDSQFYFTKKGIDAVFSHEPQGTLDVGRLIKGKAPWKQATLSSSQQRKSLLLSDWTALAWSDGKVRMMQEKFRAMRKEGFPLYIWLEGDVVPMTEETIQRLEDPEFRKKITPVSQNELIKQAVEQQGMTYDEVMSLDDYWVSYLENANVLPEKRTLSTETILAFLPDNFYQELPDKVIEAIRIAEQANPPCSTLILDDNSRKALAVKKIFQDNFPHFSIKEAYRQFEVTSDKDNQEQIEKNPEQFEELQSFIFSGIVSDPGLDFERIKQIENLEKLGHDIILDPETYKKELEELKLKETTLKQQSSILFDKIKLNKIKHLTLNSHFSESLLEQYEMPELEYLTISQFISADFFFKLLTDSPKLRYLNLNAPNPKQIEYYLLPEKDLPDTQLETVIFNHIRYEHVGVGRAQEKILKASPNLKKLTLRGTFHMAEGFADRLNLTKLEELNFSEEKWQSSTIAGRDLRQLIQNAPGLKRLNICGCVNIKPSDLNELDLSQIETFKFPEHFKAEEIQKLLQQMPNLKMIDFSNLKLEEIYKIQFEGLRLNQLERIKFPVSYDEQNQSISKVQQHFNAAPHLSKYRLQYFIESTGSETEADRKETPTGHLRKLKITDSQLNSESFSSLIDGAAKLQSLAVNKSTIIGDQFSTTPLLRLRRLEFLDTSIETPIIEKLLAASTDLRELVIQKPGHSSSKVFDSKLSGPLNLSTLERLTVKGGELNTHDLQCLLAEAGNLRTLNLDDTNFLYMSPQKEASVALEVNLPHLEELNAERMPVGGLKSILSSSQKLKNLTYAGNLMQPLGPDIVPSSLEKLNLAKASFLNDEYYEKREIGEKNSWKNEALRELLLSSHRSLRRLVLPSGQLGFELTNGISFPNLKELVLGFGTLNKTDFIELIKAAPNLEVLDLKDCTIDFGHADKRNNTRELEDLIKHLESIPIKVKSVDEVLSRLQNMANKYGTGFFGSQDFSPPDFSSAASSSSTSAAASSSSSAAWSGSSNDTIATDPVHNHKIFKDLTPADKKQPFQYRGQKRTLNQGMLIEQLSQYCEITEQHQHIIPHIQDGMCYGLSKLFLDKKLSEWELLVDRVSKWNGKTDTLTDELESLFDEMTQYVSEHQIKQNVFLDNFVGDAAWDFLNEKKGSHLIANPWHAIAIRYDEKTRQWLVYDPNFLQGHKTCSEEELKTLVQQSLGNLISIYDADHIEPSISNFDTFFAEGGLFSLCSAKNISTLLLGLPDVSALSQEALDGMLLRGTNGTPAWVLGLNSPQAKIKDYTKQMLEYFVALHPETWQQQLQHSISAMSAQSRHNAMANLHSPSQQPSQGVLRETIDAVSDILRVRPSAVGTPKTVVDDYKTALQTWSRDVEETSAPLVVCQKLFVEAPENQLLELSDSKAIDTMGLQIQEYCKTTERECFYVDSPEDLVCSAAFIRRDGVNGFLSKGPGGALHDFLSKQRPEDAPAPVLLINYDNFDANDLVRFNSLLDPERRADGTEVPSSVRIIGLFNPDKPDSYKGSDFYSRFGRVQKPHLESGHETSARLNRALVEPSEKTRGAHRIQLYHAPDWKEQLLGRWVLENNALSFREGELVKAFNEGAEQIQIEKGLWKERDFIRFWEEAIRLGYIDYEGQRIELPENFQLLRQDEYNWQELGQNITLGSGLSRESDAILLNPSVFGEWFTRYRCENSNQSLTTLPGWLCEESRGTTIKVNLTRELGEDEWARIADACNQFDIRLHCHVADGLALPEFLQFKEAAASSSSQAQPSEQFQPWQGESEGDIIIQSNDIDTTVARLTEKDAADTLVLDISGSEPADFIHRLDAKIETTEGEENPHFVFNESELALLKVLDAGKKVILKGNFNPVLSDTLTAKLLARATAEEKGQLILVTNSAKHLTAMPAMLHEVSVEEKQRALLQRGYEEAEFERLSASQWHEEPLSQLQTRLNYWRKLPEAPSSDAAWQGMLHLEGRVRTGSFNPSTSAAEAKAFQENRLKDVHAILERAPYVYLSGLTAVGKTSFVENTLCGEKDRLYTGEQAMQAWANDPGDGMKILFIDEANLADIDFNHFEGLYANPPSILINGEIHPLTPQHKLVFAGNPLSYGEGRSMPEFFKRHGNALVFEPMSQAFVYEKILKPVFANTDLEQKAPELSAEILRAYSFLCECSTDRVLISPRELQMIALLTVTSCRKNPQLSADEVAGHFIRELARPLVPAAFQSGFDKQFPFVDVSSPAVAASSSGTASLPTSQPGRALDGEYWLSESRVQAADTVTAWLDLRDYRQQTASLNVSQKYGGLGAMVLEGTPAAGKSELLISLLRERGFEEARMSDETLPEHAFFRMPVSMPLEEKKALLLKAFHAGAVVLVDELNSSPMLERFMNALLMGKNPEAEQDEPLRPERTGFMLFGTQNPASMQGRIKAGEALERRQQKLVLPDYKVSEVRDILIHKGAEPVQATRLAEAFIEQSNKARIQNLNPPPTLREVIRLAGELVSHAQPQQAVTQEVENPAEQRIADIRSQVIRIIDRAIKRYSSDTYLFGLFSSPGNPTKKEAFEALRKVVEKNPIEIYEMQDWYKNHYDSLLVNVNKASELLNATPESKKSIDRIFRLLGVEAESLQPRRGLGT